MAHEPKKRHSRARQGKRRNHIHLAVKQSIVCPNCSAPQVPHTVCETCGFYKGQQIVKTKSSSKTSQAAA
jgi:large subunit ribosomal protein L32